MSFKEMYKDEFAIWQKKFEDAKNFMKSKTGNKVLIECAAQHPLINGEEPGEEFKKRLDFTFELYQKYSKNGYDVKIYIPGSRHMDKGIKDKISLSLCGKKYLVKLGVPGKEIYSVNANLKYKGYAGVYNSADECYVAANIFKDDGFDKLISVVSPAQMYRKTLFYIQFGVIPLNFSAPTENMYHNYVGEMFGAIPFVLTEDNTWQDDNSNAAVNSRNDRCPYLKEKITKISDIKEDIFDKKEYKIDLEELITDKKMSD